MAGLAAAAEATARGARVLVLEKGDRAGGSMLLSSGVVWRHRRIEDFRRECPSGDEVRQRQVWQDLDGGLDWLESLGARVTRRDTGNPLTTGRRFDTSSLTGALVRAAGGVETGTALTELPHGPVILATGGFAASRDLVREWITPQADSLILRSNPWSAGDGLRLGLSAGGATSAGMDEFYGRAMPAAPAPPGRSGSERRSRRSGRSSSRPGASQPGSRASAGCSCGRTVGARATASTTPARPGPRRRTGWTSSTAAPCPPGHASARPTSSG